MRVTPPPVEPPPSNCPIVTEAPRSNVAPATFTMATAVVARIADAFKRLNVPPAMFNCPVNVFAPDNVTVPEPAFVIPPSPKIDAEMVVAVASPRVNR